VAFRPEDF